MIGRSAEGLGLDPPEPKLGKIEFVHKDVDHPDWIVLAESRSPRHSPRSVICPRSGPSIRASNPYHRIWHGNHIAKIKSSGASLHSQGHSRKE